MMLTKQNTPLRCFGRENRQGPRSFARKFTNKTNITPAKFIEIIRLEKALTIFEAGGQSIETIAYGCSFKSPYQFRSVFERKLKIPAPPLS